MNALRLLAEKGRVFSGVIVLTCLIIMSGCPGSGVGRGVSGGLAGAIGSVCVTGEDSYRVELSGSPAVERRFDMNPFESAYGGSIGGQIRGLAVSEFRASEDESTELLFWGSGAAIKYGTIEDLLGTVLLARPGAVNDMAAVSRGGSRMIAYASERGLGLVGPDSSGAKLVDYSKSGAWRPIPNGVNSLAVSADGSVIFFATADGFLQQITVDDLISGEPCSGIVTSETLSTEGASGYVPLRVQAGPEHVFVLSRSSHAPISAAPTFEQAYHPLLKSIIEDAPYSRVRAIRAAGGGVSEVGFAAKDGSFDRFDRFIPSDIAWDGQSLYVVGLAYDYQSAQDFIAQECAGEQENLLKCVGEAAEDGSMVIYEGGTGLFRFIAGFFVYRDLSDLSRADHFKGIQISSIQYQENAPPLIYAIGVKNERGFVRGPNFLASISRGEAAGGSESWTIESYAQKSDGLSAGLPNRVVPYQGGAAASYTALKAADGSGASALEVMSGSSSFAKRDTGAIYVRVDGAGAATNLVATIEMANATGGELYLENAVQRRHIDITYSNSYVSHADYDGTTLAFSWSSGGTGSNPEHTQHWRIRAQAGSDWNTAGELFINRAGGPSGEFTGFPAVSTGDTDPSLKRHIGGITLADSGDAVAVMYAGYHAGKWYHQVALYGLTKSGGKYNAPSFKGMTGTVETTAARTAHEGRVLGVSKSGSDYRVVFSTPKKVFRWDGPSGNLVEVYNSDKLVDAAIDAGDKDRLAIIEGFNVHVRKVSTTSAQGLSLAVPAREGTTLTRLFGGRAALSGSLLALALPYGSEAAFMVLDAKSGVIEVHTATNLSRFIDVKIFSSFPEYLLASSPSSGIEIYKLSGN